MIKQLIAACAVVAAYRLARPVKAKAWFSITHEDITRKALELLKKEGKAKQYQFFKQYENELLAGCTEPDDDGDVDKGAGRHYYSVCDPKGRELPQKGGYYKNRLGAFSKSARTLLEENYTSALCLFKSGRVEEAVHVFARAAHFIEDMSCTVHVSNMEWDDKPMNVHNAYEKHINTICSKFEAERFDKRLSKSYEGDSFEAASNKLIKASAKYVDGVSTLDPVAFREAASDTLSLAQQNVMALMLKFYDDCLAEGSNYIEDGKSYTLRNEASGLVLTATSKGLVLDKPDRDKAQRFTANVYGQGAFGFSCGEDGFINAKLTGLEKLSGDKEPALFKLSAYGKKKFRITVGTTEYERVIACTRSGKLTSEKFDPESKAQVWNIV